MTGSDQDRSAGTAFGRPWWRPGSTGCRSRPGVPPSPHPRHRHFFDARRSLAVRSRCRRSPGRGTCRRNRSARSFGGVSRPTGRRAGRRLGRRNVRPAAHRHHCGRCLRRDQFRLRLRLGRAVAHRHALHPGHRAWRRGAGRHHLHYRAGAQPRPRPLLHSLRADLRLRPRRRGAVRLRYGAAPSLAIAVLSRRPAGALGAVFDAAVAGIAALAGEQGPAHRSRRHRQPASSATSRPRAKCCRRRCPRWRRKLPAGNRWLEMLGPAYRRRTLGVWAMWFCCFSTTYGLDHLDPHALHDRFQPAAVAGAGLRLDRPDRRHPRRAAVRL